MQTAESDIEDVHAHPCLHSVSTYANEREVKQYLNLLKASVPHLAKRMSRKRKKPTQKTKHALPNTKRRPAKRFPTGKFNSQADEKIQELKIKTSQYRRKLNNLGVPPGVANHLLRKAQSEAQQAPFAAYSYPPCRNPKLYQAIRGTLSQHSEGYGCCSCSSC